MSIILITDDTEGVRALLADAESMNVQAEEILVTMRSDAALLNKPLTDMNGSKDETNINGRSHPHKGDNKEQSNGNN